MSRMLPASKQAHTLNGGTDFTGGGPAQPSSECKTAPNVEFSDNQPCRPPKKWHLPRAHPWEQLREQSSEGQHLP